MTNGQKNPDEEVRQRQAYVRAFNSTMVKIWKERIAALGVIDSGQLYSSVVGVSLNADQKITSVELKQKFLMYGIYLERGVGSNTPKGNAGDIGRDNPRRRRPWFNRKHFASFFNLREFMADSLGRQACIAVTSALERNPRAVDESEF